MWCFWSLRVNSGHWSWSIIGFWNLHAILSETIAYVEVDLESGQLKAAGGLWESYRAEWEEGKECFCEPAFRSLDEVMIPEEREFLGALAYEFGKRNASRERAHAKMLFPPKNWRRDSLGWKWYSIHFRIILREICMLCCICDMVWRKNGSWPNGGQPRSFDQCL